LPPVDIWNGGKISSLCTTSEKLRLGSGLGHQCFDRFAAVTVKLESPIGQTAPFAIVAHDIVIVGRSLYFLVRRRLQSKYWWEEMDRTDRGGRGGKR
jgi:hypothetical protein